MTMRLLDFVRTNEYQGGQLAAQHLIELGHNHMIIVAPYDMMANMSTRVAGFVDTLRANQLPEPPESFHLNYLSAVG